MESPGSPPNPDSILHGLQLDALRDAVSLYLKLAYPDGEIPASVQGRLIWDPDATADELLTKRPFEADRSKSTNAVTYALRLGNWRYPHMKLQIQPWPSPAGFLLSVNTHDQALGIDPNTEGLDEFRAIQAENQRLKESIEQAWDENGLPTFLRYLKEYIEQKSQGGPGLDQAIS